MQEFKNDPDQLNNFQKKLLSRSIPIVILAVGAGLAISYFSESGGPNPPYVYLVIIAFAGSIVYFSLRRSLRMQKELYIQYRILMEDDRISAIRPNAPPIVIPFNEITKAIENSSGDLIIRSKTRQNYIIVSRALENKKELISLLSCVCEIITEEKKSLFQKYSFVLIVVMLGLMASIYLSANKILVAVAGFIVIPFLCWSLYSIQTNKQLTSDVKRSSWMILIVIGAIIVIVCQKIFNLF